MGTKVMNPKQARDNQELPRTPITIFQGYQSNPAVPKSIEPPSRHFLKVANREHLPPDPLS
jgi:hypothetical protein